MYVLACSSSRPPQRVVQFFVHFGGDLCRSVVVHNGVIVGIYIYIFCCLFTILCLDYFFCVQEMKIVCFYILNAISSSVMLQDKNFEDRDYSTGGLSKCKRLFKPQAKVVAHIC